MDQRVLPLDRAPCGTCFCLGLYFFSKIVIIVIILKIRYSLCIRFVNSELVATKEKLEIVKSCDETIPDFLGRNAFELIQEYCTKTELNGFFKARRLSSYHDLQVVVA